MILLVSLTYTVHLSAYTPVPNDFAYGMKVETPGQASLWQTGLPEEIYQKVTRADLGDIRVFDASGQIIPHVLQTPAARKEPPRAPAGLPLFPLYSSDVTERDHQSLRIVTDEKGAVVNIVRESTPGKTREAISAYLLDASTIEHTPDKLILDWQMTKDSGFSAVINIDVSNDLSGWRRLVDKATLADLQFGDHQLSQHAIVLPLAAYNYLRINWPAALREVELKAATVAFPTTEQPPQRYWIKIIGVKNPGSTVSYGFDTNGHWPVDRARLEFPEQNMMLNAELSSRPDEQDSWQRKYLGLFYKLIREDGTTLRSPAVSFNTTNDRYWHIEEKGGGNVLDHYTPVLELGWLPHILTFVAQGNPPYVIAYGNAIIEPLDQAIYPQMLSVHDTKQPLLIKTATTTQSYVLGGVEKLEPPPDAYAWRKLLLWVALVAGTGLLSWMVWRLYRELYKPHERD
jgi:hypothetical protein